MNLTIKDIISTFINIPLENINKDTVINNTVIQGSIQIHRMYAALADIGIRVPQYNTINTYGDLLDKILDKVPVESAQLDTLKTTTTSLEKPQISIGIDIEEVNSLPDTIDYREHSFYTMNFTHSEISYCLLKPSPKVSLTGLFALKEAIIKTDNNYKNLPFSKIEISHNKLGKPIFLDFDLSISHTNNIVVAVAIKQK